jgi:hypothetical protein
MKHIVRKIYWNYENEECWLNNMAAKGLALTDYSWCRYVFEDAEPGEYIYRIELLDQTANHAESQKYISFLEDTGVEFVASYMRWVYFRKKTADGPFNLYSDIDSKITHYQRVSAFWLTLACMELFIGLSNVVTSLLNTPIKVMNLSVGCFLLAAGILFFGIGLPVFRKMRRLKKLRAIKES